MTRYFALAALALVAAPALAADDPAFGHWLTESKTAIVRVEACGASACAVIAWLETPLTPAGEPVTDINNEDPALRDRPVCGLSLASGFSQDGPGTWTGGEIYNGEDGKTYSANMTAQSDGTLLLRGYVGLPIFGASQTWTPVDGDRGGC